MKFLYRFFFYQFYIVLSIYSADNQPKEKVKTLIEIATACVLQLPKEHYRLVLSDLEWMSWIDRVFCIIELNAKNIELFAQRAIELDLPYAQKKAALCKVAEVKSYKLEIVQINNQEFKTGRGSVFGLARAFESLALHKDRPAFCQILQSNIAKN
ncbi:MAG: hypothetical protein WD055_05010 [Candidatus Dependentiae bacterium]